MNVECFEHSSQKSSSSVDVRSVPQTFCTEATKGTDTHATQAHEEVAVPAIAEVAEVAEPAEVVEGEYENVMMRPRGNGPIPTSTSSAINQAKAIAIAAQARQSECSRARTDAARGGEEERSEDSRRKAATRASGANGFAAGGAPMPSVNEGENSTTLDSLEEEKHIYSQVILLGPPSNEEHAIDKH